MTPTRYLLSWPATKCPVHGANDGASSRAGTRPATCPVRREVPRCTLLGSARSRTRRPRRRRATVAVVAALASRSSRCVAAPAAQASPRPSTSARTRSCSTPASRSPRSRRRSTRSRRSRSPRSSATGRYALLFKPGTYGTPEQPLRFEVGYFTEVAGLGQNPGDVVINGAIEVYNQCLPAARGAPTNCTRAGQLLALAVQPDHPVRGRRRRRLPERRQLLGRLAGRPDAPRERDRRQRQPHGLLHGRPAVRVRRLHRRLDAARSWSAAASSSSWSATARWPAGATASGTRCSRASRALRPRTSPVVANKYTTLDTTPVSKEKPYLYLDDAGEVQRLRPVGAEGLRRGHVGDGSTPGKSIPLSKFFVAKPGDSAATINAALAVGKNVLLTPGVYHVNKTLNVLWPNRSCSASGWRRSSRTTASWPCRRSTSPASTSPGSCSTPAR